jgi:hypothetical protein
MCPTMDTDTEQLLREIWADLGAGQRRASSEIRSELGAFRTEVNVRLEQISTRLDRLEGLMFVIKRNFEVIDLRLKTLEAR